MPATILEAPSNTLLGLIVGAIVGALAKYLLDRRARGGEWRREDRLRWLTERWSTYRSLLTYMYANELLKVKEDEWAKKSVLPPWVVGGPKPRIKTLDYVSLLGALSKAEVEMRDDMGSLGLVASEEVVLQALHFRWQLARTVEVLHEVVEDPSDENKWHANWHVDQLHRRRNGFQEAARTDLGVSGRGVPVFLRTYEFERDAGDLS